MNWKRGLGIGLLFVGLFLVSTARVLTGAVVGSQPQNLLGLAGLLVFVVGVIMVMQGGRGEGGLERQTRVNMAVTEPGLIRHKERAERNEKVKRSIYHLIEELEKGNTKPGTGSHGIKRTPIIEHRARAGGRIYVIQKGQNEYDLIAVSSKANQDAVINKLIDIYGRKS